MEILAENWDELLCIASVYHELNYAFLDVRKDTDLLYVSE